MSANFLRGPGRATTVMLGGGAPGDMPMEVAVVLESVTRFHPLTDGNKRTGLTLIYRGVLR
ncbi:Fic family protein [Arthrobacter pascens]|uniref:Fic family protein n=1 Tax=Arthrobacter pascens TaxID=1677 RepID=UPI00196A3828|nr:Fic family protein [Arthrobacter pascens]